MRFVLALSILIHPFEVLILGNKFEAGSKSTMNFVLWKRTSPVRLLLRKWSNGSRRRKRTRRKTANGDGLGAKMIVTCAMDTAPSLVAAVCRRLRKLTPTKQIAERRWQTARSSIERPVH